MTSQRPPIDIESNPASSGANPPGRTPPGAQPGAFPPVHEWIPALQGWFLALYAKLIYHTSPVSFEGWEHIEAALETKRPILLASWHGQPHLFYSAFRAHFNPADVFLVSPGDERQGVLAYLTKYLGAMTFPVSMQDKSMAGARNLLHLIGKLGPGKFCYLAPDGPDGPARVPKAGATFIARKAGALIVPVANAARYALHVPRWDRYWLPLPFDRIYTVYGPPIDPNLGVPPAELLETLTKELNLASDRVEALASKRT